MKSLPFRKLLTLVLLSSLCGLTGCVLTNAESMTLGGTGQVKTSVEAWKARIQVDEVRGAECGRKNIVDFLRNLEKKGLENNSLKTQATQTASLGITSWGIP
jgi:hypothetical protein